MAPNNNDNDYALVRNKSNYIDMEIAGEVQDNHILSLRHWSISFMRDLVVPQTTEEWEDYFFENGRNVFVVRGEEAYPLYADCDIECADDWTIDEFDRTYIMLYPDELNELFA